MLTKARAKQSFETDVNWHRAGDLASKGARALPRASAEYVLDKFPIIGWLPRYDYRWLLNDVIAGLTLGIMLIPQSLAYAGIATIPVQFGLMSSWFPAILYAFMGTSKDLSTGPTSLIGLLTAEVVRDLSKEGYSPQHIASAVALGMGIYGLILGFLKLGFLLDFVSTPVLNGFISAVAITIGLGQVDNLLGEENVRDPMGDKIHDLFSQLPTCNPYTVGIGFGSVILIVALEQAGKRWGQKNKVIFYLSICKQFLALVLFTGISYGVNRKYSNPDNYLFEVAEVQKTAIYAEAVDSKLFTKAFPRAIAPFIAAALEHVAIARAFGIRNNYVTDTSQELCYLGLTNLVNSFFHSMGVGGAMSRTAVNSSCKVKSPLSGFVTTAAVLISLYEVAGALYWIPKATLAAIVICAVWPLVGTWRTYYHYWRTSFTDFIASMLAFWLSLFVTTEIGIGTAVAWSLLVFLLREAFAKVTHISTDESRSELQQSLDETRGMPSYIPPDVGVFRMNKDLFFPNAHRTKTQIMDFIDTHYAPQYSNEHGDEAERNWSVVGERRTKKLRKAAGVQDFANLPPIRAVILDFTKVNHFDATGSLKLREFFGELKKYGGKQAEVRFVGLAPHVRERFERARPGWHLVDGDSANAKGNPENERGEKTVEVFSSVADAVKASKFEDDPVMDEKMKAHTERMFSYVEKV